jgi:hypothetical protein
VQKKACSLVSRLFEAISNGLQITRFCRKCLIYLQEIERLFNGSWSSFLQEPKLPRRKRWLTWWGSWSRSVACISAFMAKRAYFS